MSERERAPRGLTATPDIGAAAFVADTAQLIGEVVLGEGSSAWYQTVLRADGDRISIGPGSNVQDGAVLHADPGRPVIVGAGVTIGHAAVVHGCRVGDDVIIGIGARILNDAVIGSRVIIGAGAVVAENSVVPDDHLVLGVPGRVIRPLTDADRRRITDNAASYRELSAAHRSRTTTTGTAPVGPDPTERPDPTQGMEHHVAP